MSVTRAEIQEQINTFKAAYPSESKAQIKVRMANWLDGKDLANAAYTQEEQKARLVDDLVTYEGLEAEE